MNILKFPLSRITLSFVLGILFAATFNVSPDILFFVLPMLLTCFTIAYVVAKAHFIQKIYFGVCVSLLAFIIGNVTQLLHGSQLRKDLYTSLISSTDSTHILEVTIRERLKATAKNERFVAFVDRIDNQLCSGKIIFNIRRGTIEKIPVGSRISAEVFLLSHKPPLNPGQFDYENYLRNKSIYAQAFAQPGKIKISNRIRKDIWYYADKIRSTIIRNLEKSNFSKSELPVLSALILGQQQDISKEVLKDYQYAGAVHVLSVSGLHVGFILLFVNFVLKFIPRSRISSIFRIVILLLCLWGFALIAGFSPSVVRSVVMFSFVAVGMHLKRSTNIFHTLLVSILLILLFQPSFLFDVGFQLSYCALFFILWLQPLFNSIWRPKNKILNYLWNILTVSFAAQIGAFPLSVYYFHQFPGLFFITNLAIIPFLSLIMGIGVLAMVIAVFGLVPKIIVLTLESAISILNQIIAWIASADQFIATEIPFNWQMLISLYFAIILCFLYCKKPNVKRLSLALSALLLFQATTITVRREQFKRTEMVVFDVRKSSLIVHRSTGKAIAYIQDSTSIPTAQSYLTSTFSELTKEQKIQNLYYFNKQKILIIDSSSAFPPIKPDIIILRQSPKINLSRILTNSQPKIIIADGSNYKSYISLWKETCRKQKIPFHQTGEKGSYSIN